MTDFKKLDVEQVLTCVQVTAAKLRMSFRDSEYSQGLEREHREEEVSTKTVYDEESKVVDFRRKRLTYMSTNKQISAPKAAPVENEMKIQMLVQSLENMVKSAGRKQDGCQKALTDRALEGRRSLLRREKAGKLVFLGADKSGERAVMETSLYKETMTQHTDEDKIVSREVVDLAEKHLNAAASQMVRTFNFGEDWGHRDRINSASWAHSNKVPSLGGLVKTHKEELKMRPVSYAKSHQCSNGPLANLLGIALDPFIEAADRDNSTEVESTEELCHAIRKQMITF